MSMTVTSPRSVATRRRKDGLAGLWGRLIHRDREAYERWLEDRDLIMITASLLRLNERQLNRIGMSRATLALDVEDLVHKAQRDAELTLDILRIVDGEGTGGENGSSQRQIAAA